METELGLLLLLAELELELLLDDDVLCDETLLLLCELTELVLMELELDELSLLELGSETLKLELLLKKSGRSSGALEHQY